VSKSKNDPSKKTAEYEKLVAELQKLGVTLCGEEDLETLQIYYEAVTEEVEYPALKLRNAQKN
jgi:hypothetical protein